MNISQRLRTCAKHTALDAVIELLNEAADEIDAMQARANGHATQPAGVTDEQIAACVKRASTYGLPFVGLLNPGGTPSDFSKRFTAEILALRPVQAPMTDEQVDAFTVNGRLHWLGKRQLIRGVEAYYGITAQAKKEAP